MKTITLLFSSSNNFGSKFIQWAQRCPFSHVEVMFGDYSIGARAKEGVAKHKNFSAFDTIVFRYLTVSDEQYDIFSEFLHAHVGCKYDWRAYLGFALFKNTHSPERWFCSELVQEAFVKAGINVVINSPSYYVQPRDFWVSPMMKEIPT